MLLLQHAITSLFEEGMCDNGSECGKRRAMYAFRLIAERGGNALALMILVDMQTIQITDCVHVRNPDDAAVLYRYDGIVLPKGTIPRSKINLPRCPNIQLRHGAIPHVDAVNRIIGQLRQNRAIGGAVSSQLYS